MTGAGGAKREIKYERKATALNYIEYQEVCGGYLPWRSALHATMLAILPRKVRIPLWAPFELATD